MLICRYFVSKPSDELEPSTPSLPWRIRLSARDAAIAHHMAVSLGFAALACRCAVCWRSLDAPRQTPPLSPRLVPKWGTGLRHSARHPAEREPICCRLAEECHAH